METTTNDTDFVLWEAEFVDSPGVPAVLKRAAGNVAIRVANPDTVVPQVAAAFNSAM